MKDFLGQSIRSGDIVIMSSRVKRFSQVLGLVSKSLTVHTIEEGNKVLGNAHPRSEELFKPGKITIPKKQQEILDWLRTEVL